MYISNITDKILRENNTIGKHYALRRDHNPG